MVSLVASEISTERTSKASLLLMGPLQRLRFLSIELTPVVDSVPLATRKHTQGNGGFRLQLKIVQRIAGLYLLHIREQYRPAGARL